jgi:hypothetical protein
MCGPRFIISVLLFASLLLFPCLGRHYQKKNISKLKFRCDAQV